MKKPALLLLTISVSLCAMAQSNKGSFFLANNQFEINGKIRNYQPDSENGFVTIRTSSIKGQTKDSALAVDARGRFAARLKQPFEGDISLMYRESFIELYTSPGESIGLEIDDSKWKQEEDKTNAMVIRGKSSTVSASMIRFRANMQKQQFVNKPEMGNKEQGDEGFAKTRTARMQEELAWFNKYCNANSLTNKIFIEWSRNYIIYSAGIEINYYCFAGKMNKTITYPQLNNYLRYIPLNNTSALKNSGYYEFLYWLNSSYKIITNINPLYQDSLKEKGYSRITAYLDKTDTYTSGIARQLMYYYLYNNSNQECLFNLNRFNSTVTNHYLKQLLTEAQNGDAGKFISYNVLERIRKQPGGDSLAKKIESIFEKNKDSWLYIDFWGSWCSPCMIEMPLYPKLLEALKDRPVIFLFLAVDTREEKVMETKNKYKINADFISLTGNETKIFNNVLQFSSYPAHFILDPKANLASNKIPHIGSGDKLNNNAVEQIRKTIITQ